MANLSTTSPLAEGLKGFTSGIQGAIQNVGAIQGLVQQRDRFAREQEEAPLRRQALERQGEIQGMQLDQLRQQKEMEQTPWDYRSNPLYINATPEERTYFDANFGPLPKNQLGRKKGFEMFQQDEALYAAASKVKLRTIDKEIATTQNNYLKALNDKSIPPAELNTLQQTLDKQWGQRDALTNEVAKGRNQIAIASLVRKNSALVEKSPALQMALELSMQTGDMEVVKQVLKKMADDTNPTTTRKWETVQDLKSPTGWSYRDLNNPKAPLVLGAPGKTTSESEGAKTQKAQVVMLMKQNPSLSEQDATGIVLGTIKVLQDPVSGTRNLVDTVKGTEKPLVEAGAIPAPQQKPKSKSQTIWDLSSKSTGIMSAVKSAGSVATGTVGLPIATDTIYARQYVQGAQNDLIRALSINPRFPVGEINRLKEEINLAPSVLDNPAMMRQRVLAINDYLRKRVKNETEASQNTSLGTEARKNARSAANDIKNFLSILGAPPVVTSQEAYDALPNGASYLTKDGDERKKRSK